MGLSCWSFLLFFCCIDFECFFFGGARFVAVLLFRLWPIKVWLNRSFILLT